MPKVFILQPSYRPKDLSSAQRYGTLEHIFPDTHFQASHEPGKARRMLEDSLKNFDPANDYVCVLGGDPAGVVLMGHVLHQFFPNKQVQMLRWERERDTNGQRMPGVGFYVPCLLVA